MKGATRDGGSSEGRQVMVSMALPHPPCPLPKGCPGLCPRPGITPSAHRKGGELACSPALQPSGQTWPVTRVSQGLP